jgi:hypothetical protein
VSDRFYKRILANKMIKEIKGKLAEALHAFRVGRATTDLVFRIRHLTEKIGNVEKSFCWYSQTIRKHLIV